MLGLPSIGCTWPCPSQRATTVLQWGLLTALYPLPDDHFASIPLQLARTAGELSRWTGRLASSPPSPSWMGRTEIHHLLASQHGRVRGPSPTLPVTTVKDVESASFYAQNTLVATVMKITNLIVISAIVVEPLDTQIPVGHP